MEPLTIEAPTVQPLRSSTRGKTVLLAGLALVAVACWASWHSGIVLTGAFSSALSPGAVAVRTPAASRAASVGMALSTDQSRRAVLAAVFGAAAAPGAAHAAEAGPTVSGKPLAARLFGPLGYGTRSSLEAAGGSIYALPSKGALPTDGKSAPRAGGTYPLPK